MPAKGTLLTAGGSRGGSVRTPPKFPLSVSGRHLVNARGEPFYMVGDSPYGMFVNLAPTNQSTTTDLGAWLATRKAQGFNAIRSVIVCNDQTGGRADASTYDGITPFTATVGGFPDVTTPRATYWSRMDAMLKMIDEYGFLLLLGHLETQGWLSAMVANGSTRCNTYGQFIGNRYKNFQNIVWVSGNDYQNPSVSNDVVVQAAAQGVIDTNPSAIHTVQLFFLNSDSLTDYPGGGSSTWGPLIDINTIYSYNHQYTYFRIAYNRSGPLPAFLIEATYEHEHNAGTDDSTQVLLRSQMYWGLTNGLTGHFYGEQLGWPVAVGSGWETRMLPANSPGVTSVGKFVALLPTIPWQDLVPDQTNTFLTAGQGTLGALNYATAAKTADGHFAAIYIPFSTNVTVNLALMAGSVTGQWFNPPTGALTSAGTGLTGSRVFTHPGNNAGGDPDWLLLLTA